LREEYKQRVFENRVLTRIFGPTGKEIKGGSRKLCIVELHDSYSLPNIIRIINSRTMRWEKHVALISEI
jgi:hypothetical protein